MKKLNIDVALLLALSRGEVGAYALFSHLVTIKPGDSSSAIAVAVKEDTSNEKEKEKISMTIHSHDLPQTIILTGGTSGLGYASARTIAASQPDWHVVIASRNQRQAIQVVNTLKHETGSQQIEWMPLDLASLASVRAFARDFVARELPPLHAVICNAGLQVVSGTTYTQDGFETTFGVNCLGHFLLVNLLLRHLVAPARIVFVSSEVTMFNRR